MKDTEKVPLVWETMYARLTIKDAHGLPGETLRLIVARNVRYTSAPKFFVSNALEETPLSELLHLACSRWHVERCFEDQMTELGPDHFEVRRLRVAATTLLSRLPAFIERVGAAVVCHRP